MSINQINAPELPQGEDEANTEENLVAHTYGVGSQGVPSGQATQNEDQVVQALEQAESYDTFATHEPNFLPPFANAENKSLNKDVQSLEKALDETEASLEELCDRTSVMDEHLKSVQSELSYTQQRVTSKAKEVQSEEHLKSLSEREAARHIADVKTLSKERTTLVDRVMILQNQIYRANEKMDQFKVLMNWNQEELEQWALTRQQKEEDNQAIERYRAQDDSKIKELNIAVERMNKTMFTRKTELDKEVTDTQAAQVQLDKAADDFARLHKERQDLMRQWDDAMEQMRRNDDAIQAATQLFADKKGTLREKQVQLDICAKFLDDELVNNKERDAQIDYLSREMERVRGVYSSEQGNLKELSEQVEIIKSTLSKAGNDHESHQAENRGLRKELEKKRLRLDDMRRTLASNRRKLESDYLHLDSLEQKEKELETLRSLEGKRMVEVEKKLSELEKVQFNKGQDLFKQRAREKDLVSEISGGQAQNRNLVTNIQQLDDQVIRQQELLYNVEFQLQQMERKVSRAKGERSDEESNILNEKIEGLTQQLEGVNEQHNMLLAQVKKAEDDLGKAVITNTKLTKDQSKVQEDMAALNMETDMIVRTVKSAAGVTQQRLVDMDVQKLEVQHLRKVLNSKADEVFALENKKFQLQQSLHERRHEIDVHRQTLETELKLLRDDCHRVTLELQQRRLRMGRLEAKFDVMSKRNKSVYEEDEPKSQAYYVIKNAQEREELQKTGDVLDGENQRLEREVAALERTLDQMIESNTLYNKSFKPVNEKLAFEERAKLRQKLDKAYDRLKFKRQEERSIVGDVLQAQARQKLLADEESGLVHAMGQLQQRREEANASIQEQGGMLERAQGHYDYVASLAGSGATLARVKAVMQQESNTAMLRELWQLEQEHPALRIVEMLRDSGVQRIDQVGESVSTILAGGSIPGAIEGGRLTGSRGVTMSSSREDQSLTA